MSLAAPRLAAGLAALSLAACATAPSTAGSRVVATTTAAPAQVERAPRSMASQAPAATAGALLASPSPSPGAGEGPVTVLDFNDEVTSALADGPELELVEAPPPRAKFGPLPLELLERRQMARSAPGEKR